MSDKLQTARSGKVLVLTINRPEIKNALDFETADGDRHARSTSSRRATSCRRR